MFPTTTKTWHHHFHTLPAGPLPITIADFWRLVWQEEVETISMVTNLQENTRKKCERYWPDIGSEQHGAFKVTLVDKQIFANYILRELNVERKASWQRV